MSQDTRPDFQHCARTLRLKLKKDLPADVMGFMLLRQSPIEMQVKEYLDQWSFSRRAFMPRDNLEFYYVYFGNSKYFPHHEGHWLQERKDHLELVVLSAGTSNGEALFRLWMKFLAPWIIWEHNAIVYRWLWERDKYDSILVYNKDKDLVETRLGERFHSEPLDVLSTHPKYTRAQNNEEVLKDVRKWDWQVPFWDRRYSHRQRAEERFEADKNMSPTHL